MIYFDTTRSRAAGHRSGLIRVSSRLLAELGDAAQEIFWSDRSWRTDGGNVRPEFRREDWVLTPELFCEGERPGFWEFVRARPCRLAAIFHDAIPIKLPHITWPQSVSRHPEYMKLLANFDRVFAVSEASRREVLDFWRWQGTEVRAEVGTLPLGANFTTASRSAGSASFQGARFLCVGIIEPRKNQGFLLDVCESLWAEGISFELNLVGRINPHFGGPLMDRIHALRKVRPGLRYHQAASDEAVERFYREATCTVFPTIAEGCGLPLLESLWMGTPCVCSDLPVLRENAGGGCRVLPVNDVGAWKETLRQAATDTGWSLSMRAEAAARTLPTWADAARRIRTSLAG